MPQLTVGTTPLRLVAYNRNRKRLLILNEGDAGLVAIIRVNPSGIAGISQNIPVFPRGSLQYAKEYGDKPELDYYVVSDTANTTVTYEETYEA